MNKSIAHSFNSLIFLASMLGGSSAVSPPAMAETCMTDSLMMVYEPIETPKCRTKKPVRKIAHANQKAKAYLHNVATKIVHSDDSTAKASNRLEAKETEAIAKIKSVELASIKTELNKTRGFELEPRSTINGVRLGNY